MNRARLLLMVLGLLLFVSAGQAQSPHSGLAFLKEKNNEGTMDYVLKPDVEEINRRLGGNDKPFKIIGALARPAKQVAVLLFVNAQKEFQFPAESDTTVVITADASDIRIVNSDLAARSDDETQILKTEIVNILVYWKEFQKISRAKSVTVTYGPVTYQLDKDNIDALHFLMAEIEKDQKTP